MNNCKRGTQLKVGNDSLEYITSKSLLELNYNGNKVT